MKPHEIEQQSFAIIDEEAGPHQFSATQWPIVRRMIHTSADFEYMTSVRFHPRAVDAGVQVIRSGGKIDGFMFQSCLLNEAPRPSLPIFDFKAMELRRHQGEVLPLISMCSYCQRVRDPGTERADVEDWIVGEEYYRRGGSSEVQISHGICPDCYATQVKRL